MRPLHIIMPMAGEGSRFLKEGWDIPKPLIELRGIPLFIRAINSVKSDVVPMKYSFIVRQEHIDKYQIDEKIKTLRSEDLIKTGEELTKEFRQAKIGQDTTVLFEEKILLDNKEYWVGHTVDYIKIAVPEKENLEGQIRK